VVRSVRGFGWLLWVSVSACSGADAQRAAPERVERGASAATATSEPERAEPTPIRGAPPPAADAPPAAPPAPLNEPGRADLDPTNDALVAPPDVIPDCETLLAAQGAEFSPASLPLRRSRAGRECGTPQAVAYRGVKGGARYSPTPVLSCGMALSLARFEPKLQSAATEHLGGRVVRVRHLGTYNCRDMARFDLVSEHSYANAIDVSELVLANGRAVSVLRHFGRPSDEPRGAEGRFLRELARRAFDEADFSCVITEFFDPLHRDHIHLDLARYRVDGTR
jgi:hypothetical protein